MNTSLTLLKLSIFSIRQELPGTRFTKSLFSFPKHKLNEHKKLRIFYQGLDAETRRKVDFKGPIPRMTPTKGMEAIKELSTHSLSWYKEGNVKSENKELQVVLNQINSFENNVNIITEEVRMAQHKEAESLPSSTETNLRGLAYAITTRSGLKYKTPKNPLENIINPQDKPATKETTTKNVEEALEQMPKYAKFMKDLLARKGKTEETSKITLNERCSTVLLNIIPFKEKDPRSFTIPCVIGKMGIDKALTDLWAIISLLSYSMYARLDLGELKPTRIAHTEEDHKIPIILVRPFLATAHAMINVFNKKISFEVRNETIKFDIEKSMKFSTPEDENCLSINMVNEVVLDHVQEILPSSPLDSFLFEPIINYQQRSNTILREEEDDDLDD
ncbi:hypothetical protein Tco_0714987 [Tanacetum coccineum]